MAVVGLLMFGDRIMDEVTSNIFTTNGYPKAISIMIVICIGILPLTKIPLKYLTYPTKTYIHSSC